MHSLSDYLEELYLTLRRSDRHETIREEVLLCLAFFGKQTASEIQKRLASRKAIFQLDGLICSLDKIVEGGTVDYVLNHESGLKEYFLSR